MERPGLSVVLAEQRSPSPAVAVDAPVPAAAPTWKNFSADGQQEAVIIAGQPTFVDVAFLERGAERARSVCRLSVTFPQAAGYGTAFRVGPRHLLTNHHVLFDRDHGNAKATQAEAWVDYETDANGRLRHIVQVPCDLDTVAYDEANDWAVVQTIEGIHDAYPVLSLEGARDPEVDDRVYIIQHPGGQPKKIAFQHNLVRAVEPELLQFAGQIADLLRLDQDPRGPVEWRQVVNQNRADSGVGMAEVLSTFPEATPLREAVVQDYRSEADAAYRGIDQSDQLRWDGSP